MSGCRATVLLILSCGLTQGCVSYQRSFHTIVQNAAFPEADSADVAQLFEQLQLPRREQAAPQAEALLQGVSCPVPPRGRLRFVDFLTLADTRDDEQWLVLEPRARLVPRSEQSWPAGIAWQWSLYVQVVFVSGAEQLRLAVRGVVDFEAGAAEDFPWLARELSAVAADWLAEQVRIVATQRALRVELQTEPTLED